MSTNRITTSKVPISPFELTTLAAFIAVVLIGGSNVVAVRFSNLDLPPFWGAATRFAAAGMIFWMIVLARKLPVPRVRHLFGMILYGFLSIGAFYAFGYWALLRVQASLSVVVLASVPLIVFLLAPLHRLETFRWRGVLGAIVAMVGILYGVAGELGTSVPIPSFLALVAGSVCAAESTVIIKLIPKSHPVTTNAVALTAGAAILLALSAVFREEWLLPSTTTTWAVYGYLVLIGSLVMFYLFLFVLGRWTASATSYAFLLFPISTIILGTWLAGEVITPRFLLGSALVLAGVWAGAIKGSPLTPKKGHPQA